MTCSKQPWTPHLAKRERVQILPRKISHKSKPFPLDFKISRHDKEISAKLYLSEGTVRNYISSILSQLDLRDRTQLAIWAVQTGVTSRDFGE